MNRSGLLERLKSGREFDLLVIGGGATGCGVAVDAATRGLDVALVDRADFAQGTSSRSTKLVHGGVRYLEKAVLQCDREQFGLVREGLRERGFLLANAPHLAHAVRLLTPVPSWKDAGYMFAGLTLYDLLAGRLGLGHSKFVSKRAAERMFPTLRMGDYKAAVTYWDGQFNDARMAVALARTANAHGATCCNHVEVTHLIKEGGRLRGAELRDMLTGETWTLRARGIINATGPLADTVRRMDDPGADEILKVSSGIHIVLEAGFTPPDLSLMIPKTEDGRVLFMIPWQNHVVFGTTDEHANPEHDPVPDVADIDYLLRYASKYLSRPVTRGDVRAVWSGLRPLVFAPGKGSTQELARTHVIDVSPAGLLTIAGGKWTSYRMMAQDTVDRADVAFGLNLTRPCVTRHLKVVGARGFIPGGHTEIAREYGVSAELAKALHGTYGDETGQVLAIARDENLGDRVHPDHPHIMAEVAFIVRNELAMKLVDVLVRRLPMGLLDVEHTLQAAPGVARVMAAELGWDAARTDAELQYLETYLSGWRAPRD
ncbi:glycerol-3-phosphate dehydrogenase/oxidase [Nitratidesulfovibrio termitidis]|uniref:glycerol-3-phosphate dehydrogenase/oxidase n=1 Tax=Nitratidesulfovibrio termitidis TaxID=42252 RepID=UPI00040883BE|nr:FAD-dependent oxidoreductase [Nitratidesulfovibrio termitidis]